jgi:hypothetical protein
MHTLLMQRHLGIERDIPCRVMSSVEEAVTWVRHHIARWVGRNSRMRNHSPAASG